MVNRGLNQHSLKLLPLCQTAKGERGLTLVELVVVVVLLGIIGTVAITRIDSISGWKQQSDLRKFANVWNTLAVQSFAKKETYRLLINLQTNSYAVRREVQLDPAEVRNVDYLKNLRTKGEKTRRKEEEAENLASIDEEFKEQDLRDSGSLDFLYYRTVYRDPEEDVRLAIPLEFPALAKATQLSQELQFEDIILEGETFSDEQVEIRFSPNATSPLAVIHFITESEQSYSMVMQPASGDVEVFSDRLDFDSVFGDLLKLEDNQDES